MRFLLDRIDPDNPDWLTVTSGADGTTFRISQHKRAPLRTLALIALVPVVGLVLLLPALMAPAASKSGLTIFSVVIGGALLLIGGFFAVITAVFLVPAFLLRRAETTFRVDAQTLQMLGQPARGAPAKLDLNDMSHLYHGNAKADQETIVAARAGLASGVGQFMWGDLARTDNSVWVNYRGRKVFLARWLTADEAEWLFQTLGPHLGFPAETSAAPA